MAVDTGPIVMALADIVEVSRLEVDVEVEGGTVVVVEGTVVEAVNTVSTTL
jgi:hypothetical protein